MKTGQIIRQGDVYFTALYKLPKGNSVPVYDRVVARGEMTGHNHVIDDGEAEMFTIGGSMYITVGDAGISIRHAEHGAVDIPPGTYRVGIDREYDYSAQAARTVIE